MEYAPNQSSESEIRKGQSIHSILPTRSMSKDLSLEQAQDSQASLVRDLRLGSSNDNNTHSSEPEVHLDDVLERLSIATTRSGDESNRSSSERQLEEVLRVSVEREVNIYSDSDGAAGNRGHRYKHTR